MSTQASRSKITPREKEILHLIAHEHSSKEIASKLYVSYETVNTHRKNIMSKLGVRNTAGMVRVGFECGLLGISRVCIVAFIMTCMLPNLVYTQNYEPNNLDHYNYEVRLTRAYWDLGGSESGDEEAAMRIAVCPSSDAQNTQILNAPFYTTSTCGITPLCKTKIADCEDGCSIENLDDLLYSDTDKTSPEFDIHFAKWESDGNNTNEYCSYSSSRDEDFSEANTLKEVHLLTSNEWTNHFLIASGGRIDYEVTWCHSKGRRDDPFTYSNPLNSGEVFYHNYNNKKSAGGAASDIGFQNDWAMTSAGDVTYRFTINEPLLFSASLNYSGTNYDTRLYLFDADDNEVGYNDDIDYPDNLKSQLTDIPLCSGTYRLVVTGYNASEGNYNMTMWTSTNAWSYNGGYISSTTNQECSGAEYDITITGTAPGEIKGGTPMYSWEKKEVNQSTWTTIIGQDAQSITLTDQSMPEENLQYRRKTTTCSKEAYSDILTITSLDNSVDGGEILYGLYQTNTSNLISENTNFYIRKGGIIHNGIGNKTSASGNPTPLSYQWEKEVDGTVSTTGSQTGQIIGNVPVMLIDYDGNRPYGEFNDFKFRRKATNACNNSALSNELEFTVVEARGIIEGKITSPPAGQGTGIEFVEVCAVPDTTYGDPHDRVYARTECAITTNTGFYRIDSLYTGDPSGDGIRYIVSASYFDHDIEVNPIDREVAENDSTQSVVLKNNATQMNIDFEDKTAIAITGNIYHDYTDPFNQTERYGKKNVVVEIEQVIQTQTGDVYTFIGADTTDALGNYGYALPSPGEYRITPKLDTAFFGVDNSPVTDGHVFVPDQIEQVFVDNTDSLNFEDQAFERIYLSFGGACNRNIGSIKVDVKDKDNGNVLLSNYDVSNNLLPLNLPAREYEIDVSANTNGLSDNVDQAVVTNQLTAMPNIGVNLLFRQDTLAMDIDERPVVRLEGFDTYYKEICIDGQNQPDVAVLEQFKVYPDISVMVSEGPEASCKLDAGSFTAKIGTDSLPDLTIVEGVPQGFQVVGAFPNFETFTIEASFSAKAPSGLQSDQVDQTILTEGAKKNGVDFISVSPELPVLILHDPPTDGGYAFIEQGTTINTTSSTFAESSNGGGLYTNLRYGVEFDAGVDVFGITFSNKYEIFGTAEADVSSSYTNSSTESITQTLSINKRISTSDQDRFIGEDGDVVVTTVINKTFADALELKLDGCEPIVKQIKAISKDSVQSIALRTIWDIKNVIIPDLERLKDLSTSEKDINNYGTQIAAWREIIKNNQENVAHQIEEMKADSIERISIGAGVEYDYEMETDSVYSSTFEYYMEVDEEVALGARLILAGNGGDGKVYGKFQQRFSTEPAIDTDTSNTVKTGYHFYDDDAGDQYLIAIYEDKQYGTPLFNVEAGKSSCPYTEWNAEKPMAKSKFYTIGTDQPTAAVNVDPVQGHNFQFNLKNRAGVGVNFEIGKDFTVGQNSNVTINSSNEDNIEVFLASGQETVISVKVKKSSGADNQMVRIYVIPKCDDLFLNSESISFNVAYVSQISPITIANITPGQLINSSSEVDLDILMKDYDKSKMDRVFLEYKKDGGTNYSTSTSFDFPKNQLGNDPLVGTIQSWDTSEIPEDGDYLIKLTTVRDGVVGNNGSQIIPIKVDRSKPYVFGLPEPVDDNYDINDNDVISVNYNENVCPNGVTNAVATIEDIGHPGALINTVASCFDNRIVIVEDGISLNNRAPSLYRVKLSGVEDVYGNVADDYYWTFLVGAYDPSIFACLPDIYITNNNLNQDAINATAYRALVITSDGEVPNFGTTSYKAQDEILLNSGFEVNAGGIFEANIESCDEE